MLTCLAHLTDALLTLSILVYKALKPISTHSCTILVHFSSLIHSLGLLHLYFYELLNIFVLSIIFLAFSFSIAGTFYIAHFNSLFTLIPFVCSTSAKMDNVCRGCNKTIKTTVVTCKHCYRTYHPTCTTFKQVRNKADKLINACRSYISAANPNKQKTKSINESITENLHVTTQTAHFSESAKTPPSSQHTKTEPASVSTCSSVTPSSDELLSQLLGKMNKLDKLDGIEKQISNFQTSLQDINDKIKDFSGKLQVLESIHALVQRVDATVEDIDKLKSDYNSLRQTVDSQLRSSVSAEGAADISGRLHHLEEINPSLSSRLSELADTQQRLSSDIVLGGFKHKIGVNLRDLAFVILKTIHPELESRDIISARTLRGKDRRKELSSPSTSSAESTDTTIETQTSEPTAS